MTSAANKITIQVTSPLYESMFNYILEECVNGFDEVFGKSGPELFTG